MMRNKENWRAKTVGISLQNKYWDALEARAKDLGTNPHRLAADAIKHYIQPHIAESPTAKML